MFEATFESGKQDEHSLDSPGVAKKLQAQILSEIDDYCATAYDDGFRNHLGGSMIGDECSRKLFYSFRWCFKPEFSGRQQRLFNRGHREEDRFVEWLEGIGFKVWFEDRSELCYIPESDEYILSSEIKEGGILANLAVHIEPNDKNYAKHIARAKADGLKFKQYRTSGAQGHFGGSLDGIAEFPARYGVKERVLLEFKTNGTGAGYDKVEKEGMPKAKPMHFAQTCTYGSDPNYNFGWVLYLIINKNDDSLTVQLVKLNHEIGNQMRAKAERIIFASSPPPKISNDKTVFACKFCDAVGICQETNEKQKNCRSCVNSVPIENAQWGCKHFNQIIPADFIKTGCADWKPFE